MARVSMALISQLRKKQAAILKEQFTFRILKDDDPPGRHRQTQPGLVNFILDFRTDLFS